MGQRYSRDWMILAPCRGGDPHWDTDFRKGPQTRRAEALCKDCPVKVMCARYHLDNPEDPPTGVIVAGTVMPEDKNTELHAKAMEQLKKIAEG